MLVVRGGDLIHCLFNGTRNTWGIPHTWVNSHTHGSSTNTPSLRQAISGTLLEACDISESGTQTDYTHARVCVITGMDITLTVSTLMSSKWNQLARQVWTCSCDFPHTLESFDEQAYCYTQVSYKCGFHNALRTSSPTNLSKHMSAYGLHSGSIKLFRMV